MMLIIIIVIGRKYHEKAPFCYHNSRQAHLHFCPRMPLTCKLWFSFFWLLKLCPLNRVAYFTVLKQRFEFPNIKNSKGRYQFSLKLVCPRKTQRMVVNCENGSRGSFSRSAVDTDIISREIWSALWIHDIRGVLLCIGMISYILIRISEKKNKEIQLSGCI